MNEIEQMIVEETEGAEAYRDGGIGYTVGPEESLLAQHLVSLVMITAQMSGRDLADRRRIYRDMARRFLELAE